MAIYFSKTTNGFYDTEFMEYVLPNDVVEITPAQHLELLEMQTQGYSIVGDDTGYPTLIPPDFTPPPLKCTAYQIRQALNLVGIREAVETAVADGGMELKDAWNYSQAFERNHPRVIEMGDLVGQTSEDLDALFELAITLNP